jgi:ATP-dependent protease HslVU (ClpYQ) peptidase subunit
MTILVAVKKNGRVFLGADRITTFGNEYHTDLVGGQKIIKLKNAYLATSGYTLMDNVIEHLVMTNHKMMDNPFTNRADVFSFFLEMYGELKKAYTLVDTGKDTYAGIYNVFFIVTATSIYGVSNNLSVSEYPEYACKGAGSDYSLGCLYALYDTVDDGYELVRLALEAACHFSVYCKEPLDIIEVRPEDFKGPLRGYKTLGKHLRTLPKRKSAGNILEVAKPANKPAAKPSNRTGAQKPAVKTVQKQTAPKNNKAKKKGR